jgi:hypothetical protein
VRWKQVSHSPGFFLPQADDRFDRLHLDPGTPIPPAYFCLLQIQAIDY